MASDDTVRIKFDQPVATCIQPMPKQAYRFGVDRDEVFVYAVLAEPLAAAQKVWVVLGVEHVKHEIRRSS